jgi:hypothetical protein
MLTHDAVKLLAHVAELRVWEERMVAAIGAGAEASDLHERMGLDESACKTRLYRAGVRTGLGSVDIITRVLRILCRRGETGLDEVERLGVRVRSRPTSQVKP